MNEGLTRLFFSLCVVLYVVPASTCVLSLAVGLQVIGANMGVLRMTKEHLAIALALKVPVVVAITKIDRAPAHVYEATVTHIQKLLKSPGARKLPVLVKSADELAMCAQNIVHDRVVPIFSVSNVTGEGLDLLRGFLNLAPSRRNWAEYRSSPTEFAIDETFLVPGVGTVVSGTCSAGSVGVGQSLSLGPDHSGAYVSVIVKSVRLAVLDCLRFAASVRGGAACARLSVAGCRFCCPWCACVCESVCVTYMPVMFSIARGPGPLACLMLHLSLLVSPPDPLQACASAAGGGWPGRLTGAEEGEACDGA